MKTKNAMKRAMLFAWAIAAMCLMPGCLSDGKETYVLEEPQLTASKMIIGGWRQSTVKAVDEDGNDVPLSSIEGIDTDKMPDISFGEDGDYTATYPDGNTETGSWNISDDDTYLNLGEESWKIYSFGENKLVLVKEIYYGGKYYYIMYIFEKVSSAPGTSEGEEDMNTPQEEEDNNIPPVPGLGNTSDNNPYKSFSYDEFNNQISQITLTRTDYYGKIKQQFIYSFQYDAKQRIIDYTIKDITPNTSSTQPIEKINFTYDDYHVHIYYNGEQKSTGHIDANGHLDIFTNENSSKRSSFSYSVNGFLAAININSEKVWLPGNFSLNDDNEHISWNDNNINNIASINFNGLVLNVYGGIESEIHDYCSSDILILFDFCGEREKSNIATGVRRGIFWNDERTKTKGYTDVNTYLPTLIEITQTWNLSEYDVDNTIINTYDIEYKEIEKIKQILPESF